jgi:hypothetical protein
MKEDIQMWLADKVMEMGGTDKLSRETAIPFQMAEKYVSLEYELNGKDLESVANFLGMSTEELKLNHLSNLLETLNSYGMKWENEVMRCQNLKLENEHGKYSLFGSKSKTQFSNMIRALEYAVRSVKGEISL